MMKRFLIIIIVGLICLILGVGGGILLGNKFFGKPQPLDGSYKEIAKPGAMLPLGDFTVNLADKDPHIVRFNLVLELSDPTFLTTISEQGWISRIKNEIILTCKNRYYDDLRTADGVLALAQDISKRLNAILPPVKDKLPVRNVLFQEFIIQ